MRYADDLDARRFRAMFWAAQIRLCSIVRTFIKIMIWVRGRGDELIFVDGTLAR